MWFGENNIKYITLVPNNGKAMRFAVIFFSKGEISRKKGTLINLLQIKGLTKNVINDTL